jgi:chromosome partitioning related protein ParA
MKVVSIISTKGGVGKTTVAANLGGLAADAGLRVLLVDLDVQPTLSSYFALSKRAPSGMYELLAQNEHLAERVISHTLISRLDLVFSNDQRGQLNSLLLHAADGRLRLRNLLRMFRADYDLMLIDTQGARSVLLEMAVLASELAIAPVTPEILAARELHRGTVQLMEDVAPFRNLGIPPPPLKLLINRVHPVSSTARAVHHALRQVFASSPSISVLETVIPALEAYSYAATHGWPVHRMERRKPHGRRAPSAIDTMKALMSELFPEWATHIEQVTGTPHDSVHIHGG